MVFTMRSRTRMCAPTASTKYTVSIAVVNRANAGILLADSKPITEAALVTGRIHRMFSGTPSWSRTLVMYGTGIAHATPSAAWKAASAAYVFGEVRTLMSLTQLGRRRQCAINRLARVGLGLRHCLDNRRISLGGEPVGGVLVVVFGFGQVFLDRRWHIPEHAVLPWRAEQI